MTDIKFPDGSQLSITPLADGATPLVIKGFDSVGGTIGSEGELIDDTVLSDEQAKWGASDFKNGGERELLGRWHSDDEGQTELKQAATDKKEREFKLRVGKTGPTWTFKAVVASVVMADLEKGSGLRFKAKIGVNEDGGLA